MFERYTEKARRSIFFARYEASEFGSPYIETEFLLLGLLREDKSFLARWLCEDVDVLREEIARQSPRLKKTPTSVDLPLSNEAKRVLTHASEEAEWLAHPHIGTEHLFLGLLRDPKSYAGQLLRDHGVEIGAVRQALAHTDQELKAETVPPSRLMRLRIANEEGEPIASLEWRFRLPAIGECISLPVSGGGVERYRILDLSWGMEAAANSTLQVSEVVVRVRKVNS